MPTDTSFERRMLINGKLVEGRAGGFANINPATEEMLGEVSDASAEDMSAAIDAAREAFDGTDWSTNHSFRQRCLQQLQDAIEAEREELREELIREVGCPRALTHGPQLDAPLEDALRYPASLIDTYPWELSLGDAVISVTGVNTTRHVWREAVGVVGAIVPWNFPFEVTIQKLGQALATGNTVILKPAPDTPFNATRLGRLVADHTDIPAGVLNVVTASDHLIGEQLTMSPKVDLISFTGSTGVGKRIMEKGAATMKRLFLELGGKSATIVLDDADLAFGCMMGIAPCVHAGQGCANPTRLLLPRSRYDEGVEILKGIYSGVAPGDPQDPATLCGPVISDRQRARIRGYIDKGIAEGATLAVGGSERPDGLDNGFFVTPTLFVDVDNSMTIAQEEIFGPVLRSSPTTTRTTQSALPTTARTASLATSCRVQRSARCGWRGDFEPASSASTAQPVTAPTHRSADIKRVELDDKTVRPGLTSTRRSSRSPSPLGRADQRAKCTRRSRTNFSINAIRKSDTPPPADGGQRLR